MNRWSHIAMLLSLRLMSNATAADAPSGKALFNRNCGPCHAAGQDHPGTMRLAQTRGAARAVLEQRTDLDAAYIRLVVRQGLVEMPPWRVSEIDDVALNQIVEYLTHGRR
jgi:mono/diheme cytochrome c family protein